MADPVAVSGVPTETTAAGANPVDDAGKVFAGNLAFATTEDDLKAVFEEVGEVTHIQIIRRGTRSLGYGFVTFATEEQADKAVSTLDKREVAGRPINVEGAKPQQAPKASTNGEGGAVPKEGTSRNARRRRGARKAAEGQEAGEGAQTNGKAVNGTTAAAAATEKPARQPRKPRGPPEGEPSKTLLFVANLPFRFTDEQLKEAFAGFQVKSAKVIKRFYGSRTKGFGFVDMENEEEQQRALKEVQGKEVEGRALSLKVAVQGEDRKAAKEASAEQPATAEA